MVKIIGAIELISPQVPLRPFMSSLFVTASSSILLFEAIEIRSKRNIRRLPLTDNDTTQEKLVGTITETDIIITIVKSNRN